MFQGLSVEAEKCGGCEEISLERQAGTQKKLTKARSRGTAVTS